MSTIRWQRIGHTVFRRQYPDSWLWGACFAFGALWYGFIAIASTAQQVQSGEIQRVFTERSAILLLVSLSLLISAVGLFKVKPWGYLSASVVCGALAAWYALPMRDIVVTGLHLYMAVMLWRGYRWFRQDGAAH